MTKETRWLGTKPRFSGIKLATGYDRANYRFSLLNLQQGRIISAVCQSLTARKIRYNEFCGRHRFLIAIPFCLETDVETCEISLSRGIAK